MCVQCVRLSKLNPSVVMTSWGPGDLKEHRDHFIWKNTRNCVCYMVLSHNLSKKKAEGETFSKILISSNIILTSPDTSQ